MHACIYLKTYVCVLNFICLKGRSRQNGGTQLPTFCSLHKCTQHLGQGQEPYQFWELNYLNHYHYLISRKLKLGTGAWHQIQIV